MPERKKGILVIHGIGEVQRGAALASVVNPLVRYLSKVEGGDIPMEAPSEREGEPAHVMVGARGETWVFAEAWWARPASLRLLPDRHPQQPSKTRQRLRHRLDR